MICFRMCGLGILVQKRATLIRRSRRRIVGFHCYRDDGTGSFVFALGAICLACRFVDRFQLWFQSLPIVHEKETYSIVDAQTSTGGS